MGTEPRRQAKQPAFVDSVVIYVAGFVWVLAGAETGGSQR